MSPLPAANSVYNRTWHSLSEEVQKASRKPSLAPIPEEDLTLEVEIAVPQLGSSEKPSVKHPGGGINYVW